MSDPVRLYDANYSNYASAAQATVRREAFGEDIGQNSWLTVPEYRRFWEWLALGVDSRVLDVASGAGGPALFLARSVGCRLTGIDINEHGVANANRLAAEQGVAERVRFLRGDASRTLPLDDASFDAVLCIDAINHLDDRARVLRELARVLVRGGRLLFTDPIVVTGIVTSKEIELRSSIGHFLWTPEGANERLIAEAGLELERREDVTAAVATIAERRRDARARHRDALLALEDAATFDGQQAFLEIAARLAAERRLSRFAYLARRP
jgi:SAM-dependent methyltransferase